MGINVEDISEERIFETYDRTQIREVFEREFEAKNIGRYLGDE